jgi:hypothetical protein
MFSVKYDNFETKYDKERLYIAKLPINRNFNWVYDVLTAISKEDIDNLKGLLDREIEADNGDWRGYTEDLLELLETLQGFFK